MAPSEKIAIPQKPPMVMIDRIVDSTNGLVTSAFLILPGNVFCHRGRFTEAGLIENMAQTAAAAAGLKSDGDGRPPRIGFIGGIRDLVIHHYPEAGQEILTTIEVEHEVFNASVVRGTVKLNGSTIASCQLKIFLQDQTT